MAKVLEGGSSAEFVSKTLGQFFFDQADKFPTYPCQINGNTGQKETFESAKQRSVRLAIQLKNKFGITHKDVVATCSCNSLESVLPVLAATYLGSTIANLDPALSLRHTKHLVDLVQPSVIFADSSSLSLIENSLKQLELNTKIILLFKDNDSPGNHFNIFDLLAEESLEEEKSFKPTRVDFDATALIFFSSGTTGLPKGICHSHRTFLTLTLNSQKSGTSLDTVLHFTTFYWISGMLILTRSYLDRGCRVFSQDVDGNAMLEMIDKFKITNVFVAPIYTYKLTNGANIDKYDTSSLSSIITGGTPISTEQLVRLRKCFPHADITFGYGMSECGIIAICKPGEDESESKPGTTGKLCSGIKLKIVDLSSNEALGPNEKGEICVKTPGMMTKYYKMDTSHVFDEDHFLKTGDIGWFDEDGYVYVVERIKEMFKYQSWHIVPSAIETVILEHPAVAEAVVFGIPKSEEEGDLPAACVVLKSAFSLTGKELEDFVAERVSDKERLRGGVTFVESLPKTPSGKLIRRDVRRIVVGS